MIEPDLREAVAHLRNGGIVAHATEGVFGFACDPFSETAVLRILAIKSRNVAKGLILIGGETQFDEELSSLESEQRKAVLESWPGAVTWVLPCTRYPAWITGDHKDQVAVRRPGHTQARALCAAFGGPLVSTSANKSGEPPALSVEEVHQHFGHLVDYVLPGETLSGTNRPSEIRSLTGVRLRAG